MKPHVTLVSIRLKTHEVNANGECVPPAVEDTGAIVMSFKGLTKGDIIRKKEEFLQKVKQWIAENNQ